MTTEEKERGMRETYTSTRGRQLLGSTLETREKKNVVYVKDSCPRIFLVATQRIDIGEEIVFKF